MQPPRQPSHGTAHPTSRHERHPTSLSRAIEARPRRPTGPSTPTPRRVASQEHGASNLLSGTNNPNAVGVNRDLGLTCRLRIGIGGGWGGGAAAVGALAAGGNAWRREKFSPLLVDVSHIAPCYEYAERQEGESSYEYGQRVAQELRPICGNIVPNNCVVDFYRDGNDDMMTWF